MEPKATTDLTNEQNKLRFDAYYYSFTPTGIYEIDLILSAVACAGKSFHYTADWIDDSSCGWINHEGASPVDWIQNAANKAAIAWRKRHDRRDE